MLNLINETITNYFKIFTEFTKETPVIAGVVSLWGLSVGTWLIRKLPQTFLNFIERQFTVKIEFHSSDKIFYQLDCWFNEQKFIKRFRTLKIKNGQWGDDDNSQITAGIGYHWFLYKFNLYKYNRIRQDSQGVTIDKETIELIYYGRSQKKIRKLMAHIIKETEQKETGNEIKIYEYINSENYWKFLTKIPKRPWDSIILNSGIKEEVEKQIVKFMNEDEKKWKLQNGINNKITILLEGPPGTGKTTLVKTIASKFDKNIYILSFNEVSDRGLRNSLSQVPENGIILIEDIDSCKSTKRNELTKNSREKNDIFSENSFSITTLTTEGILNALDGITSFTGRIVFTTTNHPDKINKAILRKGRVNFKFHLGYLENKTIRVFLNRFFEDIDFSSIKFKNNITPAVLESYILEYKSDIKKILKKIIVEEK